MRLTRLSIRRPKLTIVGMILFILLGTVSLTNLPLQLFPEINPPVGAVVSSYPGASPEEVKDKVTKPLEEELSTLPGLNRMTSTSEEGMALILLEFSWDSTIDEVEQDITSSINVAEIADEASDPSFLKFDPSMMGMIQMAITSNNRDVNDFQGDVEDFQTELERIKGIANVEQAGGVTERFEVRLSEEQLNKHHLTQEDIVQTIQSHEVALPGGTVETEDHTLSTRVLNQINGEKGLSNLVIGTNSESGGELLLSDVSEIERSPADQTAITRADQEPALQLTAMKETDANAASVSAAFDEKLNDLLDKEEYEDLNTVTFFDEGKYVQQSIDSVTMALIFGAVFAMLVLFFFLRNIKTPLIIGIAIPFSVVVTFGFLYFTDVSLNLMTLGGLALGIGMLVDNAIVVIENIYRHLSLGEEPKEAAFEGTTEVGGAITASTLTTVSVFLPIVFISGIVGNIFTEFALAVAFSLIASLFVALTVVPMLASRILTMPEENLEKERQQSSYMRGLDRSIRWVLSHRTVTLVIAILLFFAGGAGIMTTGINFLPTTDEGFFTIDVKMDNGTKLEDTKTVVKEIESILEDETIVEDYMAVIGSSEDSAMMGGPSGSNEAQMFVTMVDLNQREQSTVEFIEEIESDVTGVNRNADISLSTQAAVGGGEANTIVFNLSDSNAEYLKEAVSAVQEDLEEENTVRDVETSLQERAPEMQVRIDEEAARNHGLVPAQIAQTVEDVTRGQTATNIQSENNETLNVVVKYNKESFNHVNDLKNLNIPNDSGEYIKLEDLAKVEEGKGPAVIHRLNQEPSAEFTVTYSTDTNLNDMSHLIEDTIENADLRDSTSFSFTGEQELLEDAVNSLVFAFVLALLFIYLVMAGQFESFKYPFVVMFSVPLITIGVMLALTITQTPLSVTVFIGLIVLAGIVVNNAIVLVDYMNQMKEQGMPSREAIIEGVRQRTRPILMTAVTTILGVVPLALGIGEGTEIQQPMGIAVIGGLVSSTFLTLFVVPVLYSLFDKETRGMNKRYITPDGQVVYPHELPDRQADNDKRTSDQKEKHFIREKRTSDEQDPNSNYRHTIDDLSKDDIVYLLEQIIDQAKETRKDEGEKGNSEEREKK